MIDAPVAVITNSTLLDSPQVRKEVGKADVVLPSLDAASESAFQGHQQAWVGFFRPLL